MALSEEDERIIGSFKDLESRKPGKLIAINETVTEVIGVHEEKMIYTYTIRHPRQDFMETLESSEQSWCVYILLRKYEFEKLKLSVPLIRVHMESLTDFVRFKLTWG